MIENKNVRDTVRRWSNEAVDIWNDTPFITLDITGTNSPVQKGSNVEVYFTVSNNSSRERNSTIEFSVDGNKIQTFNVSLNSGESIDLTGVWEIDDNTTSGQHELCVENGIDSDCATVTVTISPP